MTPVGALFPQGMLGLVRTERGAHAHGLFIATTVLSVVLTPLAVEVINVLYGESFHLNPFQRGRRSAAASARHRACHRTLLPGREAVGSCDSARERTSVPSVPCRFTILGWSRMALIVRDGTLPAIAIISMCGLAVGHLLGRPDEDDRTVLAFATVSRHPGVAVAIAALTREPLAPIGVLLAVVVNEVAVVPYRWWRQRSASTRLGCVCARWRASNCDATLKTTTNPTLFGGDSRAQHNRDCGSVVSERSHRENVCSPSGRND